MSDAEIIAALGHSTLLAEVRKRISHGMARIEQGMQQRKPLTPIEYRREELALAESVLDLVRAPCPYCSDGKRTGLPGNACENCMNTGLKYPELLA